jgi:hypothetical protein
MTRCVDLGINLVSKNGTIMTTLNASIAQKNAQKNSAIVSSLPTAKCPPISAEDMGENAELTILEQAWYEQWEFSHCAYSDLDLHY